MFIFCVFQIAFASVQLFFRLLFADIHYSYIEFKSMHSGAVGFSSKGLAGFSHSANF